MQEKKFKLKQKRKKKDALKNYNGGAWMVQLVEGLTLSFGSGHDPRVMGSSPKLDSMLSVDSLSLSPNLSLCLCHFLLLVHMLSKEST